ncbi:pyridoxamine 5'-phosphate oxidase family protein [Nocardioides sp. HM23]|uniref:pyridoxamine 5'-phosphate oxidase family protein n=1 Tax=Nocardioides bizhenqiangii TaxID=3095076 RepID=UPI002AC9F88E|nr:pyridoxamine 5'-phosphate oxidase family protein [Nocardioides sp. HM23]MDZ5622961.1 pyridoxamine 5'-phosphate oxidase family protein [Nocardioides sp. HM23]
MGKVHKAIGGRLREFIEAQHVFFVATAPLAGDGLINVSPRGVSGTFAVLDDHTFAWLDGTGSGTETIAHLRENGRITVMFCAFEGAPNIVRLHGTGRVVTLYDEGYDDLAAHFSALPGARAVVVVDVERVSDSCGYGVPLMTYAGERDLMQRYYARKGVEGSADYRRRKNRFSLDGLPGFDDDPLDEWSTLDGLAAIRERLGDQIDGWVPPVSYGLALDGEFPYVNQPGGRHGLPGVVLATVLKVDGSTATLEVSRQQLDEAITALAPAEACTDVDHPNLAAWRAIAARLDQNGGGSVTAVFVRSVDDPVGSELDATLRAAW